MHLLQRVQIKLKRHLNRWGRRFGMEPAEYFLMNGMQIRVRHRQCIADLSSIHQCLSRQQYNIPEIRGDHHDAFEKAYAKIISDGKRPLIIDGGANIGASSIWFATRYPAAHVVAVEPAPDNVALLHRNTAPFDVDVWEAGLGPVEGERILVDTGYGQASYRTMAGQQGKTVRIVTLNQILCDKDPARYEPFILKLDIEGGEAGMFDSDSNVGSHFPVIIIELHDWMLPGEKSSASFLRFHVESGRDFLQNGENSFSVCFPD